MGFQRRESRRGIQPRASQTFPSSAGPRQPISDSAREPRRFAQVWREGSQLPTSEDAESDEQSGEPVADTMLDALEFDLTVNDEGEQAASTLLEFGSDTESLNDTNDGMSEVEAVVAGPPDVAFTVDEVDERIPHIRISPAIREALTTLDAIHLPDVFRNRATVMRVPPKILRGAYCAAWRLAMNEVRAGRRESNVLKQVRGWKLFLLIPRLLLHRPRVSGLIPRWKLRERFEKFSQGRWFEL